MLQINLSIHYWKHKWIFIIITCEHWIDFGYADIIFIWKPLNVTSLHHFPIIMERKQIKLFSLVILSIHLEVSLIKSMPWNMHHEIPHVPISFTEQWSFPWNSIKYFLSILSVVVGCIVNKYIIFLIKHFFSI